MQYKGFSKASGLHSGFCKLQSTGLTALLAGTLLLGACSTPKHKDSPKTTEPKVEVTPIKPPIAMQSIDPMAERQKAMANADWPTFLILTDEIWQESSELQRRSLEKETWQQIQFLDKATLQNLRAYPDTSVQDWADLALSLQESGLKQQQMLLNLQSFNQEAVYQQHLLPELLNNLPKAEQIRQIAVFLPESGKYQLIGEFIKHGIIKSYYANLDMDNPVRLKFYDSADTTDIIRLYYQAKQEGADFIIGPVQKEAIGMLSSIDDPNILSLNTIDYDTRFTQFNLRNNHADMHLIAALEQQNYQTLAIFGSDSRKNQAVAQEIADAWKLSTSDTRHQLVVYHYPEQDLKFREALGSLVHENLSIERKNTLRWALGRKLDFFPRVRQDLDAILLLDNANRIAVFNPQFDFYQMDLDVYADESLRPKSLQQITSNRDLAGIKLLNHPYAMNPENLTNMFEAFGWDSLLLATQMQPLKNGGCLTAAKTGILSIDGNQVNQQLVWTEYDRNGDLIPFQLPADQETQVETYQEATPQNETPSFSDGYLKVIKHGSMEKPQP